MKNWADKTKFEKVLDIFSGIATVVWLVCSFLERRGVANAEVVNYVAVGVICVCQGIAFWNQKRVISYIAFAGLACMLAAIILMAMPVA